MFNKFPFHRILVLFTLFSMSLTACNAAPTLTAPELTSVPESTPVSESIPTPQPTETPTPVPTPTEVAATPTETGPKEGDKTTVTENGHTYEYTYNAELGQYVRKIASFPLLDYPYDNFMPFVIKISENAQGEQSLYKMIHKDDIPGYGLNQKGTYDPTPIKANLTIELIKRYFAEDTRSLSSNDQQDAIYDEMLGKGGPGHEQAYIEIIVPNGTPEGKVEKVTLGPTGGVILTIIDPETMKKLGGENISTMQMGDVMVYAEVYGVDSDGNMLGRLAFDRSLNEIDDEVLRNALFLFPASLVEQRDQRIIEQTDLSITLAHVSRRTQVDGTTLDLEIERVPQAQP